MGTKSVAGGLSLLGGAGIGAVLMYLFDPEKGAQRRSHISSAAGSAVHGATESLSKAWDDLSSHASQLQGHISEHAGRLKEYAQDLKDKATESAGSKAADLSDQIHHKAHGYIDSAREYAQSFLEPEKSSGAVGYTLTGVGALALGLGAMYLLDPNKGQDRREKLFSTFHNTLDQTGSAFRSTGQYVRAQIDRVASEITGHTDAPSDEAPAHGTRWDTTTRLAVGIAGGALGFYGAVRRDWVGLGAGAIGLGLVAAGLAKYDFTQLSETAHHVRDAADRLIHHATERDFHQPENTPSESDSGQTAPQNT